MRVRNLSVIIAVLGLIDAVAVGTTTTGEAWKAGTGRMLTKWAKEVSPHKVHPEYPRPQMVRERWQSLNGLWEFASRASADATTATVTLEETILVPFPPESALSGIMRDVKKHAQYRRTFNVPDGWKGERTLLHFGAVDWQCTVTLNGKVVGGHTGGYDPFSFDITDALIRTGEQELFVQVFDPTDQGDQPRGKQAVGPGGITYTSTTGIWQSVWIECVPATSIARLSITPDVDSSVVRLTADLAGAAEGMSIEATALAGDAIAGKAAGAVGSELRIPISSPRLWSGEDPFLYDLKIVLKKKDGQLVDTVSSYFGMRKISVCNVAGKKRMCLNGKPVLMTGPLDQGFWPDGLYTAPTDAALRYDLEITKELGFNMTRKHVKVEPARWYYWADKLGVLVWQDMPHGNSNASDASKLNFEDELRRMMHALHNHPSIVMWVVFNESWGQYDTPRVTQLAEKLDPSRLVSCASGWIDAAAGHIIDVHAYPGPAYPDLQTTRVPILGEFGGSGQNIPGHTWETGKYDYDKVRDTNGLTSRYEHLWKRTWQYLDDGQLAGAVYTQLTDVEGETNGILTYDRELVKLDKQRAILANTGACGRVRLKEIVPHSRFKPLKWRYTFEKPGDDWMKTDFDDSKWQEGEAGFGNNEGVPGVAVWRTRWNTPDIWIRRKFTLDEKPTTNVALQMYRLESGTVYLNGQLAADEKGATISYQETGISSEAAATLVKGQNTMAIHTSTNREHFIDAGIATVEELPPPAQ